MIPKLFQSVKQLFETTRKKIETLLMLFGDLLKKTISIPCTTRTLYKEDDMITLIDMIRRSNIKARKKLPWGCSIIMVSGMPMVVDEKYLQQLEKENEKRNNARNGTLN